MAQRSLFDHYIGKNEKYRYDKPLPRSGKMYNKLIIEELSPFIVADPLLLTGNAQITKPPAYSRHVSSYLLPDRINVTYVHQNKFANVMDDSIDPVSTEAPICVEESTFFQIYPLEGWSEGTKIELVYYQTPPEAKWAYTEDDDGLPVYDKANSLDPLWRPSEINDLIERIVNLSGINLNNANLIQYSELKTQQGS